MQWWQPARAQWAQSRCTLPPSLTVHSATKPVYWRWVYFDALAHSRASTDTGAHPAQRIGTVAPPAGRAHAARACRSGSDRHWLVATVAQWITIWSGRPSRLALALALAALPLAAATAITTITTIIMIMPLHVPTSRPRPKAWSGAHLCAIVQVTGAATRRGRLQQFQRHHGHSTGNQGPLDRAAVGRWGNHSSAGGRRDPCPSRIVTSRY